MKSLLKLTSVLILTASFFLASCSEDNMEGDTAVTMRSFVQLDAGSDLPQTGEIKRISHEVSDNLNSTVFKVEEGQMVPCDDCNIDDFEITQVFLKPGMLSEDHTFLYGNQMTSTIATHTFTGEDVIGIDMNYNGEYVRMSDIDVFSEEYREQYYSSLGELGVEVFANESTGMTSVVYNFPILSTEDDPGNSLSGMWMRIVLDFN
ncbi:hypothetical protein N9S69_04045 [Flavobacteriaceae bacterium]|nr:hypothetical protein [Flavobacteriaceae bacterium]MDB2418372.1 hypothetical protein [Flavobacteriaceae bacterium]MDB2625445.1 hypothetical protein [Flavobacteriaceae bacterium]MDB2658514.1 hypothetical protein [Flavobacteriaceae bacterium]MDB2685109.1 hypothetical protein [Flavobacteriaceae bacterium]